MAGYTTKDLVTALTGEIPSYREELLTSRDLLKEVYKADDDNELFMRIINPLKDELLAKAYADRALLGSSKQTGYV
jgi:hypothetical protein